eukprot:3608843-Rhodomonas_salina.1
MQERMLGGGAVSKGVGQVSSPPALLPPLATPTGVACCCQLTRCTRRGQELDRLYRDEQEFRVIL